MICLANSFRPGGRCVAGIDVATGQWIRPVPPRGGAIPILRTTINGRNLSVLDVVKLRVGPPRLQTRFQCENREILGWDWEIVDRVRPQQVLRYCDDTVPILLTAGDTVSPEQLLQLRPHEWKSLQLVRPRDLDFVIDHRDAQRQRACFHDAGGDFHYLKVTDPVAAGRLAQGEDIGPECLLTVSLGEPWAPTDGLLAELCYKLAAAVIEL